MSSAKGKTYNETERAFIEAARDGDKKTVAAMLATGKLDVNARGYNYERTALIQACRGGHKAIAEMLIANGADVEIFDTKGFSALMWASRKGHIDVIKMLIKNGADVNAANQRGITALMWACRYEQKKAVTVLLGYGADVNSKDKRGRGAEFFAFINNNAETMNLLREAEKIAPITGLDVQAIELADVFEDKDLTLFGWMLMQNPDKLTQFIIENNRLGLLDKKDFIMAGVKAADKDTMKKAMVALSSRLIDEKEAGTLMGKERGR